MIEFRCWYCHRRHALAATHVREVKPCSCGRLFRVPTRRGGRSRYRSLNDRLAETVIYGGGGALLGFLLALVCLSDWRISLQGEGQGVVPTFTIIGLILGVVAGERGVNWIGRMIRDLMGR
jgi:hypothetical protein